MQTITIYILETLCVVFVVFCISCFLSSKIKVHLSEHLNFHLFTQKKTKFTSFLPNSKAFIQVYYSNYMYVSKALHQKGLNKNWIIEKGCKLRTQPHVLLLPVATLRFQTLLCLLAPKWMKLIYYCLVSCVSNLYRFC